MKKLFLLCLILLLATPCLAEMVSIVHQPAELRDRAMVAGSKVIRQLPLYTPLEVLGSRSNYFQVKDADGRTGYVHQSLTGKTPSVIVTASISNVRSGPGTEFPVVFKAVRGNCYKTVAKQQEWVQITTEAGQTGWIWQNLVWGTE